MRTAVAYKVPRDGGYMVRLFPAVDSGSPSADSPARPRYFFVLDRSGSMGSFAEMFPEWIAEALTAVKVPGDTEITIITFDSVVETHTQKLSRLWELSIAARGSTRMSGVFPRLSEMLQSTPGPAVVIGISDGGLDDEDRRETVRAANFHTLAQSGRLAPVDVGLLRLCINNGVPSTSALGSLSCFRTSPGPSRIADVRAAATVWSSRAVVVGALTRLLEETQAVTRPMLPLRCAAPMPSLRRMPGMNAASVLMLSAEEPSFFMLEEQHGTSGGAGAEVGAGESTPGCLDGLLTFGDGPVSVTVSECLTNDALPFLQWMESRIKEIQVGGLDGAQLVPIQDFLERCTAMVEDGGDGDFSSAVSTRSRVASLIQKYKKLERGVIDNLLHLSKNAAAQRLLSETEKAGFLRQGIVADSKSFRGVAKRCKVDPESFNGKGEMAIRELTLPGISSALATGASTADETSYITLETSADSLLASGDLLQVGSVDLEDVLKVAGVLGVPVSVVVHDYPDPWTVKVQRVFAGTSFASQADVHGRELKYPGQGQGAEACFNAVVPLRSLGPTAFDLYTRNPNVSFFLYFFSN